MAQGLNGRASVLILEPCLHRLTQTGNADILWRLKMPSRPFEWDVATNEHRETV